MDCSLGVMLWTPETLPSRLTPSMSCSLTPATPHRHTRTHTCTDVCVYRYRGTRHLPAWPSPQFPVPLPTSGRLKKPEVCFIRSRSCAKEPGVWAAMGGSEFPLLSVTKRTLANIRTQHTGCPKSSVSNHTHLSSTPLHMDTGGCCGPCCPQNQPLS